MDLKILGLYMATAVIPLSIIYSILRAKFGEKVLFVKIIVTCYVIAIGVLEFLSIQNKGLVHYFLLAALGLCLAGDIAIGVNNIRLNAGLSVFGLAQLALSAAFALKLENAGNWAVLIYGLVFLALVVAFALSTKLLKLNLEKHLFFAYYYIFCIATAVALAFATLAKMPPYAYILPAAMSAFFVSDGLIAFTVLVKKNRALDFVCLLLYHLAITGLAISISFVF